MSRTRRTGRNRGAYSRKGSVVGLGSVEAALLAIADAQASLGMTDGELESACGMPQGVLGKLRHGQGYPISFNKVATYLESRLERR